MESPAPFSLEPVFGAPLQYLVVQAAAGTVGRAGIADITEQGARLEIEIASQEFSNSETTSEVLALLREQHPDIFTKTVLFALAGENETANLHALEAAGFHRLGWIEPGQLLLEKRREQPEPVVSIFCLCYRHEAFLPQTLEGMLAQQCSFDYRIVLGDDASPDHSRSVIYRYYRQAPERFCLLLHAQNVGMITNAMAVLAACTGQYMAICDGDDYWTEPAKLQKQVDLLESHPQYSLCFHNARVQNEKTGKTELFYKMPQQAFGTSDILKDWYAATLSMVLRRKELDEPEWLRHITNLDYAFQLLMSLKGDLYCIDEVWGVYRVHTGGISQRFIDRRVLARRIIKLLCFFNLHSGLRYRKEVDDRIVHYLTTLRLKRYRKVPPWLYNLQPHIFVKKLSKRLQKSVAA